MAKSQNTHLHVAVECVRLCCVRETKARIYFQLQAACHNVEKLFRRERENEKSAMWAKIHQNAAAAHPEHRFYWINVVTGSHTTIVAGASVTFRISAPFQHSTFILCVHFKFVILLKPKKPQRTTAIYTILGQQTNKRARENAHRTHHTKSFSKMLRLIACERADSLPNARVRLCIPFIISYVWKIVYCLFFSFSPSVCMYMTVAAVVHRTYTCGFLYICS